MRRLIVMRHAKSSWAEPNQRDLDRPLNKRGRRAAGLIGGWLKKNGYHPDLALVSSARRAQETWAGVVATAGAAETRYLPDLYEAGPEAMLAALRQAPDVEAVLMLGHQPGIGSFAGQLIGDPPKDAEFSKYPTGATAVIELDLDSWDRADWGTGRLAAFVVPRSLE